MWLSQRKTESEQMNVSAGVVTIPGDSPGIMYGHEKRDIRVLAPGGYVWMPDSGQEVAVINGTEGGMALGVYCEGAELLPGEVMVFSAGGASVCLKNNGDVYITGNVHVAGAIESNGNEAG
jgi:hypothetical protein